MIQTEYTQHVNFKFHEDGRAREFIGNTIISLVPEESNTMVVLKELRKAVLQTNWHQKMAMLPPSSFHMTVFDLVCDQVRDTAHWSSLCALDAPMGEVDAVFERVWNTLPTAPTFRMAFDYLDIGDYITVRLKPADDDANAVIRRYRNQLSEVYGIRQPNHDSYFFHISLAYAVRKMSKQDLGASAGLIASWKDRLERELAHIDLQPANLVFFDDMSNYAAKRSKARRNVTE